MSPAKPTTFQERGDPRSMMFMKNAPPPSALSINKTSHVIQKPSFSAASSPNAHQHRQPVIIYTHSPKIIHTNARDFMALVQKLTGYSPSDQDEIPPTEGQVLESWEEGYVKKKKKKKKKKIDNESSSVLISTDEKCSSMVSPMHKMPNADIPDAIFSSPKMGNAISSFFEAMKMLPEY